MAAMLSCSSSANRLGRNGGNIVVFTGSQVTGSERVLFIGRQQTGSEWVVFNGSQLAWTEQPERGLAYRKMEESGLVFDRVRLKHGPVHREGSGIPQNGGKGLVF